MSFTETVISDAQALVVKEYTSSSDVIVATIKVLAWLFFLKYYKRQMPSRFTLAAIQEIVEYYASLSANTDHINLNTDKYQQILQLVDSVPLSQHQPATDVDDDIFHVYSSLLKLFTQQNKTSGVFPTPQPIAHFMVKIVNPQSEHKQIYDPACGTCCLLVAAHIHMYPEGNQGPTKNRFLGYDIEANILPLGIMNMALHNIDVSELKLRDALAPPPPPSLFDEYNTSNLDYMPAQDVDIILTHPPQGRHANPQPKTKLAYYDSWFLQHCMDILKKNGRCAIVVSHGTLTAKQAENNKLRKDLFTNFNIQMIVSLPPKTFGERANHKTCLLFFTHGQATRETLCYDLPREKGPVEYQDFQPILDIWDIWKNYLERNTPPPVLAKDMWIETYDEIHRIEQLRAQGELIKNPYQLYYSHFPQEDIPPADPRVLMNQILQRTQAIHAIALKLQTQLEQKELR